MSHLPFRQGVFGVGSAHGADALGWQAVEYLKSHLAVSPDTGIGFHFSRTPVDMIARWAELDRVVVIDALPVGYPGQAPRFIGLQDLEEDVGLSSHGLGIREAVALAQAVDIRCEIMVIALPVQIAACTRAQDYFDHQGEPLLGLVRSVLEIGGSRISG